MRILLDMDGTGYDYVGGFDREFAAQFPDLPRLRAQDRLSYDDLAHPSVPAWVVEQVRATPGLFASLTPINGFALAANEMLDAGHEVFVCTKPDVLNPTCLQDKMDVVLRDLGVRWASRVIFTSDKTLVDADVLWDDHPDIRGLRDPSWSQILVDQPYNRWNTELVRVQDLVGWAEVVDDLGARNILAA